MKVLGLGVGAPPSLPPSRLPFLVPLSGFLSVPLQLATFQVLAAFAPALQSEVEGRSWGARYQKTQSSGGLRLKQRCSGARRTSVSRISTGAPTQVVPERGTTVGLPWATYTLPGCGFEEGACLVV